MTLSANEAIALVPGWSGTDDVKLEVLPGGWTNRNYRVKIGDEWFILRISGENAEPLGINRQHEYAAMLAAAGIGPEVVCFDEAHGLLVTRFIGGKPLAPADMSAETTLRGVAEVLKKVHTLPELPFSFSPFRKAELWQASARKLGAQFPAEFSKLQERMQVIESSMAKSPEVSHLCHNDFVCGNIMDDGRLHVIDWEYAGMGNPLFDLATFIMNGRLTASQEELLIDNYYGRRLPTDIEDLELWKRAFDYLNLNFYILMSVVSKRKDLPYHEGIRHHFLRLMRSLRLAKGRPD